MIGLQNDFLGLDKDLKVGEPMNVVMILGGLRMQLSDSTEDNRQSMKQCVREPEVMHGVAVRKAIDRWKMIQQGLNMECEKN